MIVVISQCSATFVYYLALLGHLACKLSNIIGNVRELFISYDGLIGTPTGKQIDTRSDNFTVNRPAIVSNASMGDLISGFCEVVKPVYRMYRFFHLFRMRSSPVASHSALQ